MILLTVGTQLPFDRLIRAVDEFALTSEEPVFGQIGKTKYRPQNMGYATHVEPVAFDTMARECSRIVGHAGIGTVLLARRYGKPIVLMPRRAALQEHRTDHQIATAAALRDLPGIYIADDVGDLPGLLGRPLDPPAAEAVHPGRQQLNTMLASYIRGSRSH